jgi:hypothetical protein
MDSIATNTNEITDLKAKIIGGLIDGKKPLSH